MGVLNIYVDYKLIPAIIGSLVFEKSIDGLFLSLVKVEYRLLNPETILFSTFGVKGLFRK